MALPAAVPWLRCNTFCGHGRRRAARGCCRRCAPIQHDPAIGAGRQIANLTSAVRAPHRLLTPSCNFSANGEVPPGLPPVQLSPLQTKPLLTDTIAVHSSHFLKSSIVFAGPTSFALSHCFPAHGPSAGYCANAAVPGCHNVPLRHHFRPARRLRPNSVLRGSFPPAPAKAPSAY